MADHPFKPNGTAPPFDLEEYRDTFSVWKMKWNVFIRLSNIDEVLEQTRRAQYKADVLISCLSPTTLHTVMSMGLTDADLRNPTTIITKLEERCKAGRNEHVWRYQFHSIRQLPQQSFDDFLCELRDVGTKCSFGDGCCQNCLPARLLDQIVVGVHDDDLRAKLIEKAAGLTLENAIQLAQATEAASKSVTSLRSDSSSVDSISRKSAYKQNKLRQQQQAVTGSSRDAKKPAGESSSGCGYCGSKEDHPRENCRATNSMCYSCNNFGHFAALCPSPEEGARKQINCIRLKEQ